MNLLNTTFQAYELIQHYLFWRNRNNLCRDWSSAPHARFTLVLYSAWRNLWVSKIVCKEIVHILLDEVQAKLMTLVRFFQSLFDSLSNFEAPLCVACGTSVIYKAWKFSFRSISETISYCTDEAAPSFVENMQSAFSGKKWNW